jgi:hypothetical protein
MGARELLADLACAGFSVEAVGDNLLIRPASRLTDELRAALRAAKPELLTLLAPPESQHYRLSKADAAAAHAAPWDDAACAGFVARVGLFMSRGTSGTDADSLAESCHLRDVQGGTWAWCVECRYVSRRAAAWCCDNHRRAGVGRELPHEIATHPARCPGFEEVTL